MESSQWTAPVGDPTAYSLQSKTLLLTDTQNHTGYSQVLQETTYEGGVATKKVIYTIGHDQISQTILLPLPNGGEGWGEGATHWFGTDGHGSVRVLYDFAATIVKDAANFNRLQVYTFDAYGNLQGWPTSSLTPNTLPLTTYLYSGESFDFNIGQQYLRARFYDATTGRFNRLDPFAGNSSDPQSFHKYAYVHGDPIQGTDPTGMFLASSIGIVYNNVVLGVGDRMATDLFGLEVGLDPSTMLLSKMLELLGVAIQWAGSQLSRGLPVIEAGMFLESDGSDSSPTIDEIDAIQYASSPAFLSEDVVSSPARAGGASYDAASRLVGLPGTTGAVNNFLKTAVRLAKYPVNLIAQTGKRKVYVGSHAQLGKFNKRFSIDSNIWQRHHLSQDAAFGPLGIPYGQGLTVNLKGSVTAGLQHSKFHQHMDSWWAKCKSSGRVPTVGEYNRQLRKTLEHVGFSPEEAAEMKRLAEQQQMAYGIRPEKLFKAIPDPTPA